MPAKKVNRSKSVVGSTRNKKRKSFLTPRNALVALVGVLCLSVIGGLGYQKWQDQQLTAKASGWPPLLSAGGRGGYSLWACKTKISTNYGQAYRVTIITDSEGANWNVRGAVVRNGTTLGSISYKTPFSGSKIDTRIYGWVGYPDVLRVSIDGDAASATISALPSC